MNWDQVEGKWKQASGKAKEKWGKLTDDDLQRSVENVINSSAGFKSATALRRKRPNARWTSSLAHMARMRP